LVFFIDNPILIGNGLDFDDDDNLHDDASLNRVPYINNLFNHGPVFWSSYNYSIDHLRINFLFWPLLKSTKALDLP